MIEPVIKEITVPVTAKEAFDVFTRDMGKWWPLDSHSRSVQSGDAAKNVVMDLKLGGAITETMADGTPAIWGEITSFTPGHEIAFTWHLGRTSGEQTLVTVTFNDTEAGTKVRLVHSNWENLGDAAAEMREQYQSGWDLVFRTRYGGAVGA